MSKSKGRKLAEWLRGLETDNSGNVKAGKNTFKAGSIGTSQLEDSAVTTVKMDDAGVTFGKLHTALVVTESGGIGSNDNDSTIATSAAIIDYVANNTPATYGDSNVASYLSVNGYGTSSSIITSITDSAPAALDTLNELAAALGDDANFSATTATSLGNRLRIDVSNQSLTGAQKTNALTNLGITATVAELNYVDGVTSNIQTQLDAKGTSSFSGVYADLTSKPTLFSGAYADLTGKPTIPTNNNQLTNGAGYAVSSISNNFSLARLTWANKEDTDVTADGHMVFDLNDTGAMSSLGTYGSTHPSGFYFYSGGNTGRLWTDEHFNGTHVSNWQTAYGWGNHASAGYATTDTNTHTHLDRTDNRTISPSEFSGGDLNFGFTSYNNNNSSPYADFLHMRSYTDSSGGSDNLIMFKKSGLGARLWQQSYGSSTAYSSSADLLLYTPSTTVPIGVTASTVTTRTDLNMRNYRYNYSGGTPTRGDFGYHVYQQWSNDLVLTLTSTSWQRGDIVEIQCVRADRDVTVNATRIYNASNGYDTQVTFNNKAGIIKLIKYNDTTGYWMAVV